MYEIVKFTFPFAENFKKGKPRPALVISPSFGKHDQFIVAFITTKSDEILPTDIYVDSNKSYFSSTGLRKTSIIKLHRLITVTSSKILDSIGKIPEEIIPELKKKLKNVFMLK